MEYYFEGVPDDLAEIVRNQEGLHKYLQAMGATGVRLTKLPNGWSDPRSGGKTDDAYEIEVLGRRGYAEDDTRLGKHGQCYVKFNGAWATTYVTRI